MRVIGILGSSWCGSTYVNLVLGSLPGCCATGEDHVLSRPHPDRSPACGVHGEDCPVITPDLRARCSWGTTWEVLAQAQGASVAVTSNKLAENYTEALASRAWDLGHVVLWRTPEEYVQSELKHHPDRTARRAAEDWAWVYRQIRDYLAQARRRVVVVPYRAWCEAPAHWLRRICDAMDLPHDSGARAYWTKDHHIVGGNAGAYIPLRPLDHPETLRYAAQYGAQARPYLDNWRQPMTPLPPCRYTADEVERIRDTGGCREALAWLLSLGG